MHASIHMYTHICAYPPTHPLLRQQQLLQRRLVRLRQIARQRRVALEICEASATANVKSGQQESWWPPNAHTHADVRECYGPPNHLAYTHMHAYPRQCPSVLLSYTYAYMRTQVHTCIYLPREYSPTTTPEATRPLAFSSCSRNQPYKTVYVCVLGRDEEERGEFDDVQEKRKPGLAAEEKAIHAYRHSH